MIKKVLVYTYGKEPHTNTLKVAANFAKQHDAELTGLFVRPDVMGYSTVYGDYPLNLAQTFFDLQKEYAAEAEKQFKSIVDKVGCKAEWHEVDEYEKQPKPAFYTDYIFVTQPDKKGTITFDSAGFIDRLVIETGLPLVVVPTQWSADTFAARPALGWKESREAVSAVRHTLPLLRNADEVDIVTAVRSADDESDVIKGIEISEYLASHDIDCKYYALKMKNTEHNEAETIMRHVHDNHLDAIVIGGYGHSRFRETVLGGVTRSVLRNSSVPVVLSH